MIKKITERMFLCILGAITGYLITIMFLKPNPTNPSKSIAENTQIEASTVNKPLEKIDAQEGVPIKQVVSGEIKTGQVWESNIPDPFIEKFSITIIDIKDGYVQFVCNESNRKSSCPQYWISECYKLKENK